MIPHRLVDTGHNQTMDLPCQATSKAWQVSIAAYGDGCMRRAQSASLLAEKFNARPRCTQAGEGNTFHWFCTFCMVSSITWKRLEGGGTLQAGRQQRLPARLPHQLATTPNHCKQNKVTHSILFKFCISSRTAAIFIRPRSPILLWPKLQEGEKKACCKGKC